MVASVIAVAWLAPWPAITQVPSRTFNDLSNGARKTRKYEELIRQRQDWIRSLQANQNPFNNELLKLLRDQYGLGIQSRRNLALLSLPVELVLRPQQPQKACLSFQL